MTKQYHEPFWVWMPSKQSMCFYEGGWIEESDMFDTDKQPKPTITLSRMHYDLLKEYVQKHEKGIFKTDRVEDLKIIHRLLDLMDRKIQP